MNLSGISAKFVKPYFVLSVKMKQCLDEQGKPCSGVKVYSYSNSSCIPNSYTIDGIIQCAESASRCLGLFQSGTKVVLGTNMVDKNWLDGKWLDCPGAMRTS